MACLSKSDFLKPLGLKNTKFSIGENYVVLHELGFNDLLQLQEKHKGQGNELAFALELVHLAARDDQGNRVFSTPEELKELPLAVEVLMGMAEEVLKLSGLNKEKKT